MKKKNSSKLTLIPDLTTLPKSDQGGHGAHTSGCVMCDREKEVIQQLEGIVSFIGPEFAEIWAARRLLILALAKLDDLTDDFCLYPLEESERKETL